jgi:membrane protein
VPPGPRGVPAWLKRLEPIALQLLGDRRIVRVRAVFDRYGRNGGGLLAAGIAFNTLFALIPLAIFASGIIGLIVRDPSAQQQIADFLAGLAPPLAAFLDQTVGNLAAASASLTIIGLIGAAWGATRLYASIELGVQAMFRGVKARDIVAKTLRRAAFILVIAALIAAAIVVSTVGTLIGNGTSPATGILAVLEAAALFAIPYLLAVLAIAVIYEFVPPVRPPIGAVLAPAAAAGIAIVALTQLFALIAPRLIGANAVYGTLGTVFVALGWLNLISSVLLVGAAWVRVRMLTDEEVAASLL